MITNYLPYPEGRPLLVNKTKRMAIYTILKRRELVGFAEDFALGKLLKFSGISAGSVNTHYLLETSRGKFFLKIDEIKDRQEARREIDLLLYLQAGKFACPQPLPDRQGKYLLEYEGKVVSVYPYIAGKIFSEKALSLLQLERVGQALASLHLLGQVYKKGIENRFRFERIIELYQEVRAQLPPYFRQYIHVLDDEFEHQKQYAEERLPKGVIHGDFFADNILFRGGKVVAVLDFEAAGHGKFIYDLATAVNALCYIDGSYPIERFNALLQGYQNTRTLSLGEWDAFPNELRFSALRFTVTRLKDFFLRPMDGRFRINKDFRDFLERLQVLRRERPGGMDRLLMAMATGYDYRQYQKVREQSKITRDHATGRRKENGRTWASATGLVSAERHLQTTH